MHKLNLEISLMHVYLLRSKTAAGGIIWNPVECCMSALNNALCSAALSRVSTKTDLEQELSKIKITKELVRNDPPEEIK